MNCAVAPSRTHSSVPRRHSDHLISGNSGGAVLLAHALAPSALRAASTLLSTLYVSVVVPGEGRDWVKSLSPGRRESAVRLQEFGHSCRRLAADETRKLILASTLNQAAGCGALRHVFPAPEALAGPPPLPRPRRYRLRIGLLPRIRTQHPRVVIRGDSSAAPVRKIHRFGRRVPAVHNHQGPRPAEIPQGRFNRDRPALSGKQ